MKIGELAAQTGCRVETIRFYEKVGLLPQPRRNASNYRDYQACHVARLRLIRSCRILDMSHDEIRDLLCAAESASDSCGRVNALLDAHIEHVHQRIQALEHVRTQLMALRRQCPDGRDIAHCGILRGLVGLSPKDMMPCEETHTTF